LRSKAEFLSPHRVFYLRSTILVDVSGSVEAPNKLPLLKQSLRLLVNQLNEVCGGGC
jgi:hypothetical protein